MTKHPDDIMQEMEDGIEAKEETPQEEMSLWSHINEFRQRVIYILLAFFAIFMICFFGLSQPLYDYLAEPMRKALVGQGHEASLYFSSVFEPVLTRIKLSMWAAIFFGFPFTFYQIWAFVAPALYKGEKKIALPILIGTPVLFFLGAAFARHVLFPMAWGFALSFARPETAASLGLDSLIGYANYLSISIRLILAFGICFELPLVLLILIHLGTITTDSLVRFRRYAIVLSFVVGAFLTPADIISMLALAFPLWGLYELSIFLGRFLEKRNQEKQS